MLRQERHSFLLEHIQGRAGAPLGAFTAASMAVHATPFSHSVAVGTEAVEPLRHAVSEIADAVVLTRLVFAGTPAIAEQTADGRGSAAATIPVLAELTRGWRDIAHRLREQSRRWQDAARTLERAVAALRAGVLPAADEAH
jgi:argininosuccinate lyase